MSREERIRAVVIVRDIQLARAGAHVEFTNIVMQRATGRWCGARDGRENAEAESLRSLAREFEERGNQIRRDAIAKFDAAMHEIDQPTKDAAP